VILVTIRCGPSALASHEGAPARRRAGIVRADPEARARHVDCTTHRSKHRTGRAAPRRNPLILSWILAFLILAALAGAFGFASVAATALTLAKALAGLFVTLSALTFASSLLRRRDRDALAP
jgi:uncharacterized membrane protein YtjA (UPF0391 family)